MKIKNWSMGISKRNEDKVAINGCTQISAPCGGCGLEGCHCSPGHWISLISPLENGILKGITYEFETRAELESSDIYKFVVVA